MSKQDKESIEKLSPGPKWTQAGTYSSFKDADEERQVLKNDSTLQVKVRRRHAANNFTVHFRKDPALVQQEKKGKSKDKGKKKERSARSKRPKKS